MSMRSFRRCYKHSALSKLIRKVFLFAGHVLTFSYSTFKSSSTANIFFVIQILLTPVQFTVKGVLKTVRCEQNRESRLSRGLWNLKA